MKVVKYILAVLFIFSTLGALKEGEIGAGLIFLILGIVLLPPISEQLKEKFKPWQTKGIRYVSYIVLFLTGSVLIGNNGMSNTSPTKDSISTKGEEKNNESLTTKQHIFNGNMEKVGETEEVRVIHHSLLKSWQHGNNNEDLGMDILISEEDISEENITILCKSFEERIYIVRIFSTKTAWKDNENSIYSQDWRKNYVVYYQNYRSSKEIGWMQEIGKLSKLYGQTKSLK